MFKPMYPSFPFQRGPVRVVVDSAAAAIARCLDRIAPPKRSAIVDFMTTIVPQVPLLVELFKPSEGREDRATDTDEIMRQLQAHQIRLDAVTAHLIAMENNSTSNGDGTASAA